MEFLTVKVEVMHPKRVMVSTFRKRYDDLIEEVTANINYKVKQMIPDILRDHPEATEIRWEYVEFGQGHYIPVTNKMRNDAGLPSKVMPGDVTIDEEEEEEAKPKQMTAAGLMEDYGLWVGIATVDNLGGSVTAAQISPMFYLDEFLNHAWQPPKAECRKFLLNYYHEDSVVNWMDSIAWEEDEEEGEDPIVEPRYECGVCGDFGNDGKGFHSVDLCRSCYSEGYRMKADVEKE